MSDPGTPRSAVPVDTVGAFVGEPSLVAIGNQGEPLSGTTGLYSRVPRVLLIEAQAGG